jgi:predicted nucleic acid-binding protein
MGTARHEDAPKQASDEAPPLSILFLDACILIYRFEGEATAVASVDKTLSRLQRADRDARIAVSEISRLECRVRPLREGRRNLVATYDRFFASSGLTVVPLSRAMVDLATAIRARSGLRTPDALQAACCLSLGRPASFITNDAGFRRETALDVVLM